MPVVLISGGSGLIGAALARHLIERGYQIIILTRQKNKTSENPKIKFSFWNVEKEIIDKEAVSSADYIIHLAGAGVMYHKWTTDYKKKILESRTKSAELIINCLKENEHRVKTFVSASAIGYYGEDPKILERKDGFIESDLPAKDFLGETCLLWEASTEPVAALGARLVKLRTGIVLSKYGGALKEFKRPLRFGIAPVFGNGRQIISWIHIDDLCRMYCEAIENKYLHGTYNAVAPEPVSQKKLILIFANKMRNKFFTAVHIPVFILKILLGKRSIEILKSATVSERKIKATGFTFLYPSIESAINELV
ncbi:MAG TPA: TIGR01777 family oxidoreductase [Hanamia sp.]|nr:TIGR01777 family oxidoreductase [Hanamia sp.]